MQWRVVIFVLLLLQFYPVQAQQNDEVIPIEFGVKQVGQVVYQQSIYYSLQLDEAATIRLEVESLSFDHMVWIRMYAINAVGQIDEFGDIYVSSIIETFYLLPEFSYKFRIYNSFYDNPIDYSFLVTELPPPISEDNNSKPTAHHLNFDQPHHSLLNTTQDSTEIDWYTFELQTERTIRMSLTDYGHRYFTPWLELWQEEMIERQYHGINNSRQMIIQLSPGTYYLAVNSSAHYSDMDIPKLYTISITQSYDLSPQPKSVRLEQGLNHFIGTINQTDDDELYFVLEDEVSLAISYTMQPWDWNFVINFNQEKVYYDETYSDIGSNEWYFLDRGRYNLTIETTTLSQITDYSLYFYCIFPDELERNSTVEGAYTLIPDEWIETNLHQPLDQDVFVIELEHPGNLTLQFENWENLLVVVRELQEGSLVQINSTLNETGMLFIDAKKTTYEVHVGMLEPAPYVLYSISYEFTYLEVESITTTSGYKLNIHFKVILTAFIATTIVKWKRKAKYQL